MKEKNSSSAVVSETNSTTSQSSTEEAVQRHWQGVVKRRSFLKGLGIAGATLSAGALLGTEGNAQTTRSASKLSQGDAALLRFAAAAEIIEADLWQQYNELGGVQGGNPAYIAALSNLDGDMPQYISDNTDDELSHAAFLNAYLISKGEEPVDLLPFRNLPSSKATGAKDVKRLTNLLKLNVDLSWYTRYRSTQNPDFGVKFKGPFTIENQPAIPLNDNDTPPDQTQPVPPATKHGGVEIDHFGLWHDKAGNAVAQPLAGVTDPETGVTFPDLNAPNSELDQTNLILPEPCEFISKSLPPCSVIRPTLTQNGGAVATIKAFTDDLLFLGQSKAFFTLVNRLAIEADSVRRGF